MLPRRNLLCLYCRENFVYNPDQQASALFQQEQAEQGKPCLVMVECPKCLGPNIFDPSKKLEGVFSDRDAQRLSKKYGLFYDPQPTERLVARIDALKEEAARFMVQGRYPEAEKRFRNALEVCPNHPETWHNLGICRSQAGNNAAAITAFRQATKYNPYFVNAWSNLGMLLLQSGKINEASDCFDQGIAADPSYPKCYLGKGNVYIFRGDYARARQYFELALQKDPNYAAAREALRRLAQI